VTAAICQWVFGSNVNVFVKTCCVSYVLQHVLELLGFAKHPLWGSKQLSLQPCEDSFHASALAFTMAEEMFDGFWLAALRAQQ